MSLALIEFCSLLCRHPSFQSFSPPTATFTFRKKNSSNQVTSVPLFYKLLSWATSDFTLMSPTWPAQGPSDWRSFRRSRQKGWRRTTWRPSAKSPSAWCAPPSWKSPELRATGRWGTERLPHTSTHISSPRPLGSPTGTRQHQLSSEHGGQPVLTQRRHQHRRCCARCERNDGRPKEQRGCVVHHGFALWLQPLVLSSFFCCCRSMVSVLLPLLQRLCVLLCFLHSSRAVTDCGGELWLQP